MLGPKLLVHRVPNAGIRLLSNVILPRGSHRPDTRGQVKANVSSVKLHTKHWPFCKDISIQNIEERNAPHLIQENLSQAYYFQSHPVMSLKKASTMECKRYPDTIVKSGNDPKQYRVIELQNGLKAMLISDVVSASTPAMDVVTTAPELGTGDAENIQQTVPAELLQTAKDAKRGEMQSEKLAAAALCIGAGSFSDPADIPGFAHFLEHMVFMGSEKYPDENDFDAYVKTHGGSSNAYTECENTVFYFEIEKQHFQEGLDRFAQFFIHPLMKQDSVDREIKAVDSEFSMSIPRDGSRVETLLCSFAKKDHPMAKFMYGNTESLKDKPLREGIDIYGRLQEFRQRMYSAHYMTLAIQSRESLDVMEAWVKEIFSGIPNNGLPQPSFSDKQYQQPFETEAFHRLYKVVPVKNVHELEITWMLPCLQQHYRRKPLAYLGWLVGHEGKGSILQELKRKLWATGLSAGNDGSGIQDNTTCATFSITANLTEEGMQHIPEILTIVFQYLDMLRKVGPSQRVFQEVKTIEDNAFRWQEQVEPVDNVESRADKMQRFALEDYLTGALLYFEYDEQLISQCQNLLTPDKANLMILSKYHEKEGMCELREPWYNTQYSAEDIPKDWLLSWKDMPPNPELYLPDPNDYIATDFSLREPDVPCSQHPVSISSTDLSVLWYKQDTKFKVPKAYVCFLLFSPCIKESALSLSMFDLFERILGQNLSEVNYAAEMADLNYVISGYENCMILKVYGFNHKLQRLFETVVRHIAEFEVSQELFEAMKQQQQRAYYNKYIRPALLSTEVRLSVVRQQDWTVVDCQAALPQVTRDLLVAFVKDLTSSVHVDALAQGNITAKEAKWFESCLLDKLRCSPLPRGSSPHEQIWEMPGGATCCRVKNMNSEDEQSVITNYYQHGPATVHDFALNDLLTLRMEEPLFDILRTREQLGYSVYCTNRVTNGILGFSVTVCSQASKFQLSALDEHIEKFLSEFSDILQQMTDQDFETLRNSLVTLKCREDVCLKDEVERNFGELALHSFMFDRLEQEVEKIKQATREELLQWFTVHVAGGDRCRKLSVQVEGDKDKGHAKDHAKEQEQTTGDATPRDDEEHMDTEEDAESSGDSDGECSEDDEKDEEEEEEDEDAHDTSKTIPLDSAFIVANAKLTFLAVEGQPEGCVITNITAFQDGLNLYPVSKIE